MRKFFALSCLYATLFSPVFAPLAHSQASVRDGILYDETGKEVALFGVNYSVPFAFEYRALNTLGVDHKDAIRMDINHIKRMGATAYRIHLWDREISDKDGNLLDNEHLKLFDFLLAELEKNNIKSIITMISWWGNGYPEPDSITTGFSSDFEKSEMNTNPTAIAAQKNYIQQLLSHRNRYTQQQYFSDPGILAFELFNEPKHKTTPEESAAYVSELINTARATGLKKPLFYNISEQGLDKPFAQALCATAIDGVAYQWYPTGLVANSTRQLNSLLNVAHYPAPFDTLPGCDQKAKMIYEFDAADVDNATAYPAMARSFREAGFQWATMFAYDPGHLAHTNAAYNTHYLNLLYTPHKAIGFLIASEVFKTQKRRVASADYPQSNQFGNTQLNAHENLALFNSDEKYFYSNSHNTKPKNIKTLKHIAGVGSSPIVNTDGTGTYFLDEIKSGLWSLEVYPNWQKIEDPHQSSSLNREVGRLFSNPITMTLTLPSLGNRFFIANTNLTTTDQARKSTFRVLPGKYLLSANKPLLADTPRSQAMVILPAIQNSGPAVWHQPPQAISLKDNFEFTAHVSANKKIDAVELFIRYKGWNTFHRVQMHNKNTNQFSTTLPKDKMWQAPGPLEYAIVVTSEGKKTTFPGTAAGSPSDWNFINKGYWEMELQPFGAPVNLFNPSTEKANIIYPKNGRAKIDYTTGQSGRNTAIKLSIGKLIGSEPLIKTQLAKNNLLKKRTLNSYNTLMLKVKASQNSEVIRVGVLDRNGVSYSKAVTVTPDWQYVFIPFKELRASDTILANAYPSFLPSTIAPSAKPASFNLESLNQIQGLQILINAADYPVSGANDWHEIFIEEVSLLQR